MQSFVSILKTVRQIAVSVTVFNQDKEAFYLCFINNKATRYPTPIGNLKKAIYSLYIYIHYY